MAPGREDRIRQLFVEAVQLPEAERAAFLVRCCGSDAELLKQVESLLQQSHADSTSILDFRVRREAASLLADGSKIGPYEILRLIGSGGMGEVYRAHDPRLNRDVAIKVAKERFSDRFEREARAVAALNHPNICTIFDVGPDYLVMEYLEGHALRGPLPLKTALQYAVQAADALHAAHVKGVVHRDFKPGNILITRSGLKLLDFGLAKVAAQSTMRVATGPVAESLTTKNNILGTLQYMSPEQLEGRPVDGRSDIFSFGLVLYEIIAGRAPFRADSQAGLIAAILREESPPLSTEQPVTPASLDRVVRKCLAKDAEARWQTAADLRDELQWIAQTIAEPGGSSTKAPASRPSAKWMLAALALATSLVAGALWQSLRTLEPVAWAATRLAGPSTAFCPRISPDGQLLAFLTMVNRLSQVGVMKSDGSSWTVLTTQKDAGYVTDLSWAPDGSKIYFSRYFDQPRGVYSVPVLGGETRLVVENAYSCHPLPDGSLIVAGLAAQGDYQLRRFWPESGRSDPLPAFIYRGVDHPAVVSFPGGREIAFYGMYSISRDHGPAGIYALDLETKKSRLLGATLGPFGYINRPLAATQNGISLITLAQAEDLIQVVEVPRDAAPGHKVLFSLPSSEQVNYLSAGSDGSIYLDAWNRPNLLLLFSEAGGEPEETVEANMISAVLGSLPGERFLFPTITAGKRRLEAALPGGDSRPFLQTSGQSNLPFATSPAGTVAFKLGIPPNEQIAIASFREGRILRRLSTKAAEVRSVALSPDGQTLYYAASGAVWSLPVDESVAPHHIIEGDEVAIDPSGRFLCVKQMARDPAGLVRVPVAGGAAEPILIPKNLHLTSNRFPANAVDAQGRILFETSSADSYFFSAALFDPAKKSVIRIPIHFDGDI